jgi:hypothetical protein
MSGRSAAVADWFVADLITGTRTFRAKVEATSPPARADMLCRGRHYWTIDLATKAIKNITAGIRR